MSTPILGYPEGLMMARSPQFVTGKNNTLANDRLDEMTLNVAMYTGTKSASATNDYNLVKGYSVDEVINFEISDLVRTEFLHDFNVWDNIGYSQSPAGECLWVRLQGTWTYSNNGAAATTATWGSGITYAYISTDGWATMTNTSPNPITQLVLATSRNRQVLASNYEVLALNNSLANDFVEIEIGWESGDFNTFWTSASGTTPPDPSSTNTQDLIIYAGVGPANLEANPYLPTEIKPSGQTDGGVGSYYDVILKASDGSIIDTVRYYLVCEPKYTPYQIAFINRFGVADFITFFKRSDERGNFTQDSYQKSIYNDAFTNPSLEIGKYTSFNVNSRNSLTLNTGFVDQDYDKTIKDILMSEYVAVLEGGNWIAVQPERGSVEYQKHVNQKLINYTMTFNYAFDERSLLR